MDGITFQLGLDGIFGLMILGAFAWEALEHWGL
jgi:hypothetical protein